LRKTFDAQSSLYQMFNKEITNNKKMMVDMRNPLKFCKDTLSSGELLGISRELKRFLPSCHRVVI